MVLYPVLPCASFGKIRGSGKTAGVQAPGVLRREGANNILQRDITCETLKKRRKMFYGRSAYTTFLSRSGSLTSGEMTQFLIRMACSRRWP
jgi:hypothetical protein